jgi:AcrR family transcriptional regulator
MEAFAAHGYRGASLNSVADAVGITRQGLLHYFPSKVDLLLGVLDLRDRDDTERAMALNVPSGALADVLLAVVRHNQEQPELVRLYTVLVAESVDTDHPGHLRFLARYRRYRAALAEGISEEQRAGRIVDTVDPNHLAAAILALMDGLQIQHLLDPDALGMVEPLAEVLALLTRTR